MDTTIACPMRCDKGHQAIDYVFVSTHRALKFDSEDINAIHKQCLEFFQEMDLFIIAETDLKTTYSWDGLIAARRKDLPGPDAIDIAKRPPGSRLL